MNLLDIILEDWMKEGGIVIDRMASYVRSDIKTSVLGLNRYHLNIVQFIDIHSKNL